ncbi:pyruvate synthase subunit beta [Candidatus Bathyarchaeota archaeon]|nr:pyruvate synthase subunit beta [Candidatus Bathyarchaeota archaeon]NIV43846.1 pyruvate synthase subunit beta [Candidatus Bathyarchaeota archaeon]
MVKLKELPREEYFLPGNATCAGCGLSIAIRLAYKALGPRTVFVVPACCASVIHSPFPNTAFASPCLNIAFEAAAAAASGVVAAYEKKGVKDVTVLAWAGDGGTADIGIQALSGAVERGTNFIYVCYDNESYMNTGIQRSGSTPYGAWTTTTPTGKKQHKKDVPLVIAAHDIPYVATACISYPLDFISKLRKAKEIKGPKYIQILTPCPPGWRFATEKTLETGRLAVQTGMWALFEVEHGEFQLSRPSSRLLDKSKRKSIEEYLKSQGRFRHMTSDDVEALQIWIDRSWEKYKKLQAS